MPPLWSILCAICIIALAVGQGGVARAALVLLANWCACTIATLLAGGDQFAWWMKFAWIAADALAATAILALPTSRGHAVIGMAYVVEIMAHSAYGISDQGGWAKWNYWHALYYIAWGQALFCAVWLGHDAGKAARSDRRFSRRLLAISEMSYRVGKP